MRVLITLLTLLFLTSTSFAENKDEEPSRGRLPDGRAFRTDATGNQLVDYIAELELSVEALQRKVVGLEDEIQEKDTQLARVKSGQPASPKIVERDLSDQKVAAESDTNIQAVPAPRAIVKDCSVELKQVNTALESARADLEIERQVQATKQQELTDQIIALKQTLSEKDSELGVTRTRLEEQEKVSAEAQEKLRTRPAVEAPSRAPYSVESRASLSTARVRAVESVRGKMQTELNQLKGLIANRDQMYRRYAAQKHSVAFKPGRPVSSSGRGVEEISRRIQAAQSVMDLSPLMREISDIEQKVQDDLALMQRMSKVR